MEKCKIFFFGPNNSEQIEVEVNNFLADGKNITRVVQSSLGGGFYATFLTIFYRKQQKTNRLTVSAKVYALAAFLNKFQKV